MRVRAYTTLIILLTGMLTNRAWASSSEVEFKGVLVAEPCMVATGNNGENVVVDFGTIENKTFYSKSGRRTWLQPFHIILKDCDLTLGKEVKITFIGAEDSEQPGLLAITSSMGVEHLAVGLMTSAGKELGLNKQTSAYDLSAGDTQLNFKAYVQASDEGIKNRSIGFGAFEATSTFEVEYP